MARDVAILELVGRGISPPTLRLYGWQPPCLSLGRHQLPEAADLEYCRKHHVDVVRRPTGGRAVLHHLELTYAVVARAGQPPLPRGLQEAYSVLCSALVDACGALGITAELTSGDVNLDSSRTADGGSVLQGAGSRRGCGGGPQAGGLGHALHGGAILQHGALLLDWDGALQSGAMGLADDEALRPFVTTLRSELGAIPERSALERTIAEAFARRLGVRLTPSPGTAEEQQLEHTLVDRYVIQSANEGSPRGPAVNARKADHSNPATPNPIPVA